MDEGATGMTAATGMSGTTGMPGTTGTYAGVRFDQLVVKLLCCALEASAQYTDAIAAAEAAGQQNVVEFLRLAQSQDRQRAEAAMELVGRFFNERFW